MAGEPTAGQVGSDAVAEERRHLTQRLLLLPRLDELLRESVRGQRAQHADARAGLRGGRLVAVGEHERIDVAGAGDGGGQGGGGGHVHLLRQVVAVH